MDDTQNLGPVGIWQVKNFPDGLRRAIVERAAVEKLTVGELLTRIMVAVIDAGWQVGDASTPSATRSTLPASAELRDLMMAASAAAEASGQPMSKRAAQRFYGLIDDRVRAAGGLPPRRKRQTTLRIGLEARPSNGADA